MQAGFDDALGELLTVCRRAGIATTPVEAIDARRAAMAIGLEQREDLKAALRAAIVKDELLEDAFDRAFDAFFSLRAGGAVGLRDPDGAPLAPAEIDALLDAIDAAREASADPSADGLAAVAQGGEALDRLLRAGAEAAGVSSMKSSMQTGYFTQRVLEQLGVDQMRGRLPEVREALADALGDADRAEALVAQLDAALDGLRRAARAAVDAELARRSANDRARFRQRMLEEKRFTELRAEETKRVEREVRRLAERLRGRIAVRRKRRRRGQLDVRRTMRRAHRTFGVPFEPVWRRKPKDRPRLTVLCDVSDSVRFAARFLLMLTYAMQDVFTRTRTFAFVSDLGETTDVFAHHPIEEAIELVYGGAAVSVASGSDYGKALGVFDRRFRDAVDGQTTVVIVGDGRTNYLDPNVPAMQRLSGRAARVLWLDPEPRPSWGFGDSAMPAYLPYVDEAFPVHNLETLKAAVDRILKAAEGR